MAANLTMAELEGVAFRSKDNAGTATIALAKIHLDLEPLKDTVKGKLLLTCLEPAEEALKSLRNKVREFAMDVEFGKYPMPEQEEGNPNDS